MQKPTHINAGYSVALSSILYTSTITPVFILAPFLFILADADHGQDSLSKKGLSLPGQHRGWSHSIFGATILTAIVSLVLYLIYSLTGGNIDGITNTLLYLTLYSVVFILLGSFIVKVIPTKVLRGITAGVMLFLYFVGLYLLYVKYGLDLNIILIQAFILSHIIGDYFTISGVPIFYPLSKEKFRSPIYVSTGKTGEFVVNLIFVGINLFLLFWLYTSGVLQKALENVSISRTSLYLLIFSWVVILYFLGKELSIRNFKKQNRELVSSVFNIIISLVKGLALLALLVIVSFYGLKLSVTHGCDICKYAIMVVFIVLSFVIVYHFLRKIMKETLDIGVVIVYLLIFLFQFGITSMVLYKLFS